jgi:hypothetical protein
MTTRFDKNIESKNSIILGYEDSGAPGSDLNIPSCGIEDLDRSVFDLFDKEMPLYYKLDKEIKKVPVIFASGERYAITRREKPITDSNGILILPLVAISRTGIDMTSSNAKLSNNEMFPITIKRIHSKSNDVRINNNPEGLNNSSSTKVNEEGKLTLNPQVEGNIIETVQLPPVKSYSAKYEIVIWSSFAKQMNNFIETIMSSFTINPGNQIKLVSPKGYWFLGKFDGSINQDANYEDFTDQERYVRQTFSLSASGYIINPDIHTKSPVRSYQSPNRISFDFYDKDEEIYQKENGIQQSETSLIQDSDFVGSQLVGLDGVQNELNFYKDDKTNSYTMSGNTQDELHDDVAGWSTEYRRYKKVWVENSVGERQQVLAKTSSNGETVYDQKYAELLFSLNETKK